MSVFPSIFHNLLRYDTLTFSDGVSAAFTVGYRFEDRSEDMWSARFTKFKFDPDNASTEGGVRLMAHAAGILVQGLGLDPGRTVFAPALRSSEKSRIQRDCWRCLRAAALAHAGTSRICYRRKPICPRGEEDCILSFVPCWWIRPTTVPLLWMPIRSSS